MPNVKSSDTNPVEQFIVDHLDEGDRLMVYKEVDTSVVFDEWPTADCPDAYAVVQRKEADCGIVVWGLYNGRWVANCSSRWLVATMIDMLEEYSDGTYCTCNGPSECCNCAQDFATKFFVSAAIATLNKAGRDGSRAGEELRDSLQS